MNMLDSVRDRLSKRDKLAGYEQAEMMAKEDAIFSQGAITGENRTLSQLSPKLDSLLNENRYMKDILTQVTQQEQGLYNSSLG